MSLCGLVEISVKLYWSNLGTIKNQGTFSGKKVSVNLYEITSNSTVIINSLVYNYLMFLKFYLEVVLSRAEILWEEDSNWQLNWLIIVLYHMLFKVEILLFDVSHVVLMYKCLLHDLNMLHLITWWDWAAWEPRTKIKQLFSIPWFSMVSNRNHSVIKPW